MGLCTYTSGTFQPFRSRRAHPPPRKEGRSWPWPHFTEGWGIPGSSPGLLGQAVKFSHSLPCLLQMELSRQSSLIYIFFNRWEPVCVPVWAHVGGSLSVIAILSDSVFESHTLFLSSEFVAGFLTSTMAAIAVFGILFGKNNNYLWLLLVCQGIPGS